MIGIATRFRTYITQLIFLHLDQLPTFISVGHYIIQYKFVIEYLVVSKKLQSSQW